MQLMLSQYAIRVKVLPTLQLSQILSSMYIDGLTSHVIFITDVHLWHCFWHSPQAWVDNQQQSYWSKPHSKQLFFAWLSNPGGGATPPTMPTSCLGNHRVNPFNKLTLMKTPYKKNIRTTWTTADPRHRKQQPGNAQAQCYSTKQGACPSTLATYGSIREKPAFQEDHPHNSGPHYCFYEKLKCFTARVANWVNISEIPHGKCPE